MVSLTGKYCFIFVCSPPPIMLEGSEELLSIDANQPTTSHDLIFHSLYAQPIAWRTVVSISQKEPDATKRSYLMDYKQKLESEMDQICSELVNLVVGKLLPASNSREATVFFQKLRADYIRYKAETKVVRAPRAISAHPEVERS